MNWQTIFQLSRVNGGLYLGDALPQQNWKWPRNTWLKQRLRDLRREAGQPENPGQRHVGMMLQEG
jgi:hypothetical protein